MHRRLLRVPLRRQQLRQPDVRDRGRRLRHSLLRLHRPDLRGERLVPGDGHHHPLRWHRPALLHVGLLPLLHLVQLLRSAGQPLHLQQHHAQLHLLGLWGQGPGLLCRQHDQRLLLQIALQVPLELFRRNVRLHVYGPDQHRDVDRDGDRDGDPGVGALASVARTVDQS